MGLCTAHNSLLGCRVVRSTRPVVWTPTTFVPPREKRTPRAPAHLAKNPEYPDPRHYLSATQQYFFRSPAQRHLRIEQFLRPVLYTINFFASIIRSRRRSLSSLYSFGGYEPERGSTGISSRVGTRIARRRSRTSRGTRTTPSRRRRATGITILGRSPSRRGRRFPARIASRARVAGNRRDSP